MQPKSRVSNNFYVVLQGTWSKLSEKSSTELWGTYGKPKDVKWQSESYETIKKPLEILMKPKEPKGILCSNKEP